MQKNIKITSVATPQAYLDAGYRLMKKIEREEKESRQNEEPVISRWTRWKNFFLLQKTPRP